MKAIFNLKNVDQIDEYFNFQESNYTDINIINLDEGLKLLLQSFSYDPNISYSTLFNNFLIIGKSVSQLRNIINSNKINDVLGSNSVYTSYKKNIASNNNFNWVVNTKNKMNSSSWILDEWKTQKTERDWGYWRVLDDKPEKGYKVKELVIYPGKSLSDQRHFKRSEQWNVLEGIVKMDTEYNSMQNSLHIEAGARPYEIDKEVWHQASNPGNVNAHILEVQRGEECIEEDIERRG